MKQNGAAIAMLTPAADGWTLHDATGCQQIFATLAEAAATLKPGLALHLALPCDALIIEGLRLPTPDRSELPSMVRLQLEKSLPYPLEEVSADFIVLETTPKESSVVSIVASHAALEKLCQPLRQRGVSPRWVTPYVLHVAAACPAAETVLAVYPEQKQIVLAICAAGKLSWAHIIASTSAAELSAELPQALLVAAMEGAPTDFRRVLLAPEARALTPVLRGALPQPIDPLPAISPMLDAPLNLVPPSWLLVAQQAVQARRMRRNLQLAGLFYFCVLAAGAVYWFLMNREAEALARQVAAAQPKLQFIQARQARSNILAPAADPARSTVELLYLIQRAIPDGATRITEFDQQMDQWRVVGEAPNAALAIDYMNRLKADPDLSAYQISAGPPQLLPNEHAQFNIFGKR